MPFPSQHFLSTVIHIQGPGLWRGIFRSLYNPPVAVSPLDNYLWQHIQYIYSYPGGHILYWKQRTCRVVVIRDQHNVEYISLVLKIDFCHLLKAE
jgi:hypothetical protein